MGSKHKTLQDLLHHELKDLASAAHQAAKLYNKMGKAANASEIAEAFDKRHDALAKLDADLEPSFAALDKKPHEATCEAMHGLVSETKTLLDDFAHSPALDSALLGSAKAVEHYLVARAGTLHGWAVQSGLDPAGTTPLAAVVGEAEAALTGWTSLARRGSSASASVSAPMSLKQAALVGLG